jgi:hypothetical protein
MTTGANAGDGTGGGDVVSLINIKGDSTVDIGVDNIAVTNGIDLYSGDLTFTGYDGTFNVFEIKVGGSSGALGSKYNALF